MHPRLMTSDTDSRWRIGLLQWQNTIPLQRPNPAEPEPSNVTEGSLPCPSRNRVQSDEENDCDYDNAGLVRRLFQDFRRKRRVVGSPCARKGAINALAFGASTLSAVSAPWGDQARRVLGSSKPRARMLPALRKPHAMGKYGRENGTAWRGVAWRAGTGCGIGDQISQHPGDRAVSVGGMVRRRAR